jgi:hypothetical protein
MVYRGGLGTRHIDDIHDYMGMGNGREQHGGTLKLIHTSTMLGRELLTYGICGLELL